MLFKIIFKILWFAKHLCGENRKVVKIGAFFAWGRGTFGLNSGLSRPNLESWQPWSGKSVLKDESFTVGSNAGVAVTINIFQKTIVS